MNKHFTRFNYILYWIFLIGQIGILIFVILAILVAGMITGNYWRKKC